MTFLLSGFGREVITSNRLSTHISNGDIYYNIYMIFIMIDQQNENTAYIPKTFAYRNTFEKYISGFLSAFSIEDVEKYELYTNKD